MSKEIKEEQQDWVGHVAQDARLLSNMQDAYSGERDLVNQLLGQTQMAGAFAKFSQTVWASKLAYVKEHKLYKALKGQKTPNGLELMNGTWEEFCNMLGYSDEKANQDIANLKAFGEDALESMSRMGIGYRELRQYRKLPEDQRTALIEAAKGGDKDAFEDFAEELLANHAQEKAQLEAKLADAKADNEAQGKVLAEKNAKIDQLATDLHKAKRLIEEMTPDEEARHMQEQVAGITFSAEAAIRGDLNQAVTAVIERSKAIGQDPRPYLAGALLSLERAIHEIRVHHEIPVVLDADTRPSVLRMGE